MPRTLTAFSQTPPRPSERPTLDRTRSCVLLCIVLFGISGCTASVLRVEIDPPPIRPRPILEIGSVAYVPTETKLQNVGTFAVGKYKDTDLEALRGSFQESAKPFAGPGAHRVHVVVRRVLIATSNNTGLACACVAWAIESPDGKLIFHEQFYAWDLERFVGSVAGVKNGMHAAIIRRVLESAMHVAMGDGPAPEPARTSTDFEAVARMLPSSLTSSSPLLFHGGGYTLFIPLATQGASEVGWVRKPDYVDWPAYLQGK